MPWKCSQSLQGSAYRNSGVAMVVQHRETASNFARGNSKDTQLIQDGKSFEIVEASKAILEALDTT